MKYLDYKIIDDKERQTAAEELKDDMANNNENETAGEATEENETSINDLREAKIEITQHLFQNILNKCGDEYHKLKGFKKFIEA